MNNELRMWPDEITALEVVLELAKEANPHEPPREIEQVEVWLYEHYCKDCKNPILENGVCSCDVPF